MGPALSRWAVYRHMLGSIQTHSSMAKVKSPRAKAGRARIVKSSRNAAARKDASPRGSRARWVRKNVVMDQRKLDVVKRVLGVATDKEAIDQALDRIVFLHEVSEGIDTISRSGGIIDIWKGR
jgi:hypothetical protein